MTETVGANGADRPRAQTNTERVRKHRAKKREAATLQEALQRAEAERNAALKAEAEREAMLQAALQRAERAEREVAERLKADVTEAVTSGEEGGGNAPAPVKQPEAPVVGKPAGVPAVSTPVEQRIVERFVWHPDLEWRQWRPAVTDPRPPAPAPAAALVPAPAVERPVWRISAWRIVWHHAGRPAVSAPPAQRSPGLIFVASVLFFGSIVLVGAGVVMSALYASSFGPGAGATIQAAIGAVQAAVAVAVDGTGLVLLSAGSMLWSRGRRLCALRSGDDRGREHRKVLNLLRDWSDKIDSRYVYEFTHGAIAISTSPVATVATIPPLVLPITSPAIPSFAAAARNNPTAFMVGGIGARNASRRRLHAPPLRRGLRPRADASGVVSLNHLHCAKFCVLGGGSCSRGLTPQR
jgi:hypothetical protein